MRDEGEMPSRGAVGLGEGGARRRGEVGQRDSGGRLGVKKPRGVLLPLVYSLGGIAYVPSIVSSLERVSLSPNGKLLRPILLHK